jgi:SsrA-binding protein
VGVKNTKKQEPCKQFRNNKIRKNYMIEDTLEAGIILKGTEIKSIRSGSLQINDAFARIEKEQVILCHAHIAEYAFGNLNNHDPYRPRILLLNKKEIRKLKVHVERGNKTLIPVRMYFKNALVKVELAVCTAKKLHDKRQELKKKVELREAERAIRK